LVQRIHIALLAAVAACLCCTAVSGAATQRRPARTLANTLTSGSAHTAVQATSKILVRSGITVRENGRTVARAVKPAMREPLSRFEALNIALDARDQAGGGRITLDELGRIWAQAGIVRPRGKSPGVRMRAFLATWVRKARRHPRAKDAFAPLLLAELAKHQKPSLDLGKGRYDPTALRLSLLELDVIDAALLRLPVRGRGKPRRVGFAAADPANCSDVINDYLGKNPLGQYVSYVVGSASGELVSSAFATLVTGKAGAKVLEVNKNAIGAALSLVSTIMRIQKLAALYGAVQIYVDTPTPSVERPEDQPNLESRITVPFVANVGLQPDAEREYKAEVGKLGETFRTVRKALIDCAGLFGVPAPVASSDIAEDLDTFRVRWTLDADPRDARYEFEKTQWLAPGTQVAPLTRVDKALAAHIMWAQIQTQPPWSSHPQDFVQKARDANATVRLDTSQPPTVGTLLNAALGSENPFGLADALVETLSGLFQSIKTPSDTGTIRVTFHVPRCAGLRAAGDGPTCEPDFTAHVVSTVQCAGQPSPVTTDDFTLSTVAARGDSPKQTGTVSGTWWTFNANGCTAESPQQVTAEPVTATVSQSGDRYQVSWSPEKTTRWARFAEVPATPGEHTVTVDSGDENIHYRDTITVKVAARP
jgi:hypothetical protein